MISLLRCSVVPLFRAPRDRRDIRDADADAAARLILVLQPSMFMFSKSLQREGGSIERTRESRPPRPSMAVQVH